MEPTRNEHFLLLSHNSSVHAICHILQLQSWNNKSERRVKSFEQSSVDVVRVEVGHLNWTLIDLQLLSEAIDESCECKLACRVVRVLLGCQVPSYGAHIDKMESLSFSLACDLLLLHEEHCKLNVGNEVDVHCQFELVNS